jgi:O-antigen ligase
MRTRDQQRLPSPGRFLIAALVAWFAWTASSTVWSIRPAYTLGQVEREVFHSGLAMFAFYVACRDEQSFRTLAATAIGSFVVMAALAVGMALTPDGWRPAIWHFDRGIWSTYVVLVAPMLLLLLIPAPFGFGNGLRSLSVAALIVMLLVTTLRMTDNRIAWIALSLSLGFAAVAILVRFRTAPRGVVLRWFLPVSAMLVVLALAFVDTSLERAHSDYPRTFGMLDSFALDPRLDLWKLTMQKIEARPLLGYGFGRRILGDELVRETDNLLMNHAHNLFLSTWLQTGIVGLVLFVLLLGAVIARYARFLRHPDSRLAVIGILGLALLTAFVVKNLTDDFFYRSNAKEFLVLNAILMGYGARLLRDAASRAAGPRE